VSDQSPTSATLSCRATVIAAWAYPTPCPCHRPDRNNSSRTCRVRQANAFHPCSPGRTSSNFRVENFTSSLSTFACLNFEALKNGLLLFFFLFPFFTFPWLSLPCDPQIGTLFPTVQQFNPTWYLNRSAAQEWQEWCNLPSPGPWVGIPSCSVMAIGGSPGTGINSLTSRPFLLPWNMDLDMYHHSLVSPSSK
jgi:hypothetical protein